MADQVIVLLGTLSGAADLDRAGADVHRAIQRFIELTRTRLAFT
ncbi:hypothetical protein [Nocardioides sp. YIM 152588]